jgi:hypothetical protein
MAKSKAEQLRTAAKVRNSMAAKRLAPFLSADIRHPTSRHIDIQKSYLTESFKSNRV